MIVAGVSSSRLCHERIISLCGRGRTGQVVVLDRLRIMWSIRQRSGDEGRQKMCWCVWVYLWKGRRGGEAVLLAVVKILPRVYE